MTREEFLCLFHDGVSLRQLADRLRLTDEELGAAILEARFNKDDRERREAEVRRRRGEMVAALTPAVTTKLWCTQCDRLVHREEAVKCWSKFCRAKDQAA
jgi:hypothetical protein